MVKDKELLDISSKERGEVCEGLMVANANELHMGLVNQTSSEYNVPMEEKSPGRM